MVYLKACWIIIIKKEPLFIPYLAEKLFFGKIITMEKKFILVGTLFLIFIGVLFFIYPKNQNQVCLNNSCFIVELAKTAKERSQGLMFREKLNLNKGMLFIFESEREHSFWMKNVLIPLDIIWINKNKEVVFISENNQPCWSDFCPYIIPDEKAKYVLELNGGMVNKIDLKIGDKIVFDIN